MDVERGVKDGWYHMSTARARFDICPVVWECRDRKW